MDMLIKSVDFLRNYYTFCDKERMKEKEEKLHHTYYHYTKERLV
jgi:hypothetical protein